MQLKATLCRFEPTKLVLVKLIFCILITRVTINRCSFLRKTRRYKQKHFSTINLA